MFDQAQDQYNQINNATDASHHSSIGHEALGGAAAFAAMKFFEDHQRKAGKPIEHSLAKEILAGFAGAAVDGLVESKGLDFIDKQKAKHQAKQQAEKLYDSHYSDKSQYDPNQQQPHPTIQSATISDTLQQTVSQNYSPPS